MAAATAPAQIIPFDIESQKRAASKLVEGTNLSTLQLSEKQLQVVDDESYQACIEFRNRCGTAEKRIMDFFAPLADGANKLHKAITKARGDMAAPYASLKAAFTRKAEAYLMAQKQAQREAEAALARAAAKQQHDLQREADELFGMGLIAQAEQKTQQAQMTIAPTLPDAVVKVEGAKVGDRYTGEVTDIIAFAKAIATGKVPLMHEVRGELRPILVIDTAVLNAVVSRMQGALDWPGITVKAGVKISATKLG